MNTSRLGGTAALILVAPFIVDALAGCTGPVPPSETAASVKMAKAEPPGACRELGPVSGKGGGAQYSTEEYKVTQAQNKMRERAAALGGNYVVLDTVSGDAESTVVTGRAFSCPTEPAAGAVAAPASSPAATPAAAPAPAAPPPAASVASPSATPEGRLQRLKELHDKGLIEDAEYQQRRQEILNGI